MTDEVEELRKELKESQLRTQFYMKGIEKLKAEAEVANEKWAHVYEDLYVAEIELAKFVDLVLNHADHSTLFDVLKRLAEEVKSEGAEGWVEKTLDPRHEAPMRKRSLSMGEEDAAGDGE